MVSASWAEALDVGGDCGCSAWRLPPGLGEFSCPRSPAAVRCGTMALAGYLLFVSILNLHFLFLILDTSKFGCADFIAVRGNAALAVRYWPRDDAGRGVCAVCQLPARQWCWWRLRWFGLSPPPWPTRDLLPLLSHGGAVWHDDAGRGPRASQRRPSACGASAVALEVWESTYL